MALSGTVCVCVFIFVGRTDRFNCTASELVGAVGRLMRQGEVSSSIVKIAVGWGMVMMIRLSLALCRGAAAFPKRQTLY